MTTPTRSRKPFDACPAFPPGAAKGSAWRPGAAALALLAALTAAPVSAQRVKDTVIKRNGARLRGVEVTEMTTSTIRYKRGSSESEFPASQLRDVDWYEPPEAFGLAQAAVAKGDGETAANYFLEAATAATRPILKLECEFLAARAMVASIDGDAAKAEAAVAALNAYLGKNPQGFRVPEAKLLLGRATLAAGKPAEAEAILKEVEEASLTAGWGLEWDAKAKFERAQALRVQGKHADARSAYKSAISVIEGAMGADDADKEELSALRLLAQVGQGETFIEEQDYDAATRYFAALTAGGNPTLQAAALAGEAQALFLQGVAKNDAKTLRDAQIRFARANVLDAESGSTTAKALYYSGMILLALGPTRESDSYKARAMGYFDTVVKHYPRSPWAAKARQERQKQ